MSGACNHTSAGIAVIRDGKVLAFRRQKGRRWIALPAGHVDPDELPGIPLGYGLAEEHAYRAAAARELEEETGLKVRPTDLKLALVQRTTYPCESRTTTLAGHHYHWWYVFVCEVGDDQTPRGNGRESAELGWYTRAELLALPDLEPVWNDLAGRIGAIR